MHGRFFSSAARIGALILLKIGKRDGNTFNSKPAWALALDVCRFPKCKIALASKFLYEHHLISIGITNLF
jgi:hypothetical protein